MIQIMIEGDAIPAARPRFSGRCYQPKRNREYRAQVQSAAYAAMCGKQPMTGEVFCTVRIYRRYRPTSRNFGDVDNHLKALFDGLNGICFGDDAQITRCVVEKHLDKVNPRTEVTVQELGE